MSLVIPPHTGQSAHADTLVITEEVAAVIDAALPLLHAEAGVTNGSPFDAPTGGLAALADRLSAAYPNRWNETSAFRLLYRIRYGEAKTTGHNILEAICEVLEIQDWELAIPLFPTNLTNSREMVNVWAEDWPELDRARLAEMLHRFTLGYVAAHSCNADDPWELDVDEAVAA